MKHFVLTFMDQNQDQSKTYAEYQGEFEDFLVRVGSWNGDYLIIPNSFETKAEAEEYVNHVPDRDMRDYYMVQERHYPKGDPRIVTAKIIGTIQNDFYPQPSKGQTQETADGPMVDVWTMYFYNALAAKQYVDAINDDAAAARSRRAQK